MRILYSSSKVEKQCTDLAGAKKLFGGDKSLAMGLLSRIQALESAETLQDICVQPAFRFHKLKHKNHKDLEGFYAIDIKSRKSPWRLILQPLDENEEVFTPCNIDEIAKIVRIVEVAEVSKHYE